MPVLFLNEYPSLDIGNYDKYDIFFPFSKDFPNHVYFIHSFSQSDMSTSSNQPKIYNTVLWIIECVTWLAIVTTESRKKATMV